MKRNNPYRKYFFMIYVITSIISLTFWYNFLLKEGDIEFFIPSVIIILTMTMIIFFINRSLHFAERVFDAVIFIVISLAIGLIAIIISFMGTNYIFSKPNMYYVMAATSIFMVLEVINFTYCFGKKDGLRNWHIISAILVGISANYIGNMWPIGLILIMVSIYVISSNKIHKKDLK